MRAGVAEPRPGDELSAGWGRDVARELAAARLTVCPPLALTRTPQGTCLRLSASTARGTPAPGRPWDVKRLTAETLTLTRGSYRRGPVTRFLAGDFSFSLSGLSGTDDIVSAKIDADGGTAELAQGVDEELPEFDGRRYVRVALYRFTRPTEEDGWSLAEDLRTMPEIPVYS